MGDYLSWDLISPVDYLPGQGLQFELRIQAPNEGGKKKNFYVVGALYTEALEYISDSLFYIFVPPGTSTRNLPGREISEVIRAPLVEIGSFVI